MTKKFHPYIGLLGQHEYGDIPEVISYLLFIASSITYIIQHIEAGRKMSRNKSKNTNSNIPCVSLCFLCRELPTLQFTASVIRAVVFSVFASRGHMEPQNSYVTISKDILVPRCSPNGNVSLVESLTRL
jgi:hypothetical protein